MHPINFIKRLKMLFDDAGVPRSNRLGLALSALRGSARLGNCKRKFFSRH